METIKIISLLVLGITCRFLWFVNAHKDDLQYNEGDKFSAKKYLSKRWSIASLHVCASIAFTILMPEAMPYIRQYNETLAQFSEVLGSFGVGLFAGVLIEKLLSIKTPFKNDKENK